MPKSPSPSVLALALTALLAAAAPAQNDPGPKPSMTIKPVSGTENVTVSFAPEGTSLSEFFRTWSATTGLNFYYQESIFRGRSIVGLGVMTIHRSKLDALFRSMLPSNGYALIQSGPPEATLYSVEPLDSSRTIKQRATFVPREEIAELARRPSETFATVIQLQHVEVREARTAFQHLLSNRNIEFVNEIQSSNSLLVVGSGATLVTVDAAVRAFDRPAPEAIRKARDSQPKAPGSRGG